LITASSAALTVAVEALVVFFIVGVTGLPLFYVALFLFGFWAVQWLLAPLVIGRGVREVSASDPNYGWLDRLVGGLASETGISKPHVYVSDEKFPNAFAFGNFLRKGIAFTKPLLQILNPEELRAVAYHELGRLKHHDTELGTALGLIPNLLNWIGSSMVLVGSTWLGLIVTDFDLALAFAMIAIGWLITAVAFFVSVFFLWFNRLRESYADYHAVEHLGGGGSSLATALAKIQVYMKNVRLDPFRGMVVTVPPQKIKSADPDELLREWLREKPNPLSDVLATHPHPAKRIRMILELAGKPLAAQPG